MKNIIFISLIFISNFIYSQELIKNSETGLFEYTEIVNQKRDFKELEKHLLDLGFYDFKIADNNLVCTGKITEKHNMFSVETTYKLTIDLKEDRYRFKLSNFYVNDFKNNFQLENMGSYQKKWLKKTNEKLPELVNKIKVISKNNSW